MTNNQLLNFLLGFKKGLKDFGHKISVIINSLLLLLVYVFGVGIPSIIARLTGKKFLDTKIKQDTYWQGLSLQKKPIEKYYHQF